MKDNIKYPQHYRKHPSGIECIEITEHHNFNVGNAIKYLWRAGLKVEPGYKQIDKQLEDMQKAEWYIKREISRLLIQKMKP